MTAPSGNGIKKFGMYIWDDGNDKFIAWDGILNSGDIEIGAVEIKDGDSDTRLDVELDTTKNALFVQSETLATSAKQLADGHNVTVDNATIPVTQSGTWNINDISGTISLPTGASTAANQLADGHNVTVDNPTGASAAQVQDTTRLNDTMLTISTGGTNPLISSVGGWFNKFGSSPDITSAATEAVWDGARAYIFPTSASVTHIRSAVDSAITRGATLEVQGLDTNWDLVVQTKATDATDSTVEIALDTALRRVFRVKVLDDTSLDQDIWVGPDPATAANASAIVQAGNNQTLMAIWTVPNGCTAYMTNYYCDYIREAARDPDSVGYALWAIDNTNGYAPQLKHQKGIPKQAPGFQHFFKPYYKFTQKTDVYITGNPSGAATHAHAGFDIILINN